jgi:hypothetical protein
MLINDANLLGLERRKGKPMGNTWVIDISHYLLPDGTPAPGPPARYAHYFGSIAAAATTQPSGVWKDMAVQCRRRPGRKPCPGHIRVKRIDNPARVEWYCTSCDDNGLVEGWQGTQWDNSQTRTQADAKGIIRVGVSADEFRLLRDCIILEPDTQAIIDGATITTSGIQLKGLWEDFEDLAGCVAFEANHTKNQKKDEVLSRVVDRIESVLAEFEPEED